MADKREYAIRISMILLAVLFLVTSVGLSIFVIVQAKQQNDKEKAAASQTADSTTSTPKEGQLQGTQLANFTPTTAPVTELQSTDIVVGTGEEVKAGATVTAHYTGAVAATGVIFQSSHDSGQPVPFSLDQVIAGWTEGVPGMKVGGTRRLVIPAAMAYGANPPSGSGIPANADLVFDIELVAVENK